MKRFLLAAATSLIFLLTHAADRPEPTPSKLVEIKPRDWYENKIHAWQTYLAENLEDKQGWLEYFRVMSYAHSSPEDLSALAAKINHTFEGSFEAHFVQAKHMGWSDDGVRHMKLALQSKPGNVEFLPDQIMLAEVLSESSSRKQLLQELFDTKSLYPSLLNYSYNVLMSVGENGVLMVQGESTTIPIWMLQDIMRVRPDVHVLNVDLAVNNSYLSRWLSFHGLKGPQHHESMEFHRLIRQLPDLNSAVDFYYALTLPDEQVHALEDKLYVVGLTSILRKEPFDHYSVLKENIESKFLMDYLTVDFSGEPKTATGRVYETNYVVPLLLLKEYYDNAGNATRSSSLKDLVLTIADRSPIRNRVIALMNERDKPSHPSFAIIELDVKGLDKNMVKVKDNLYASIYELTNEEYWFYLDYLNKNNYQDLYDHSVVDVSQYDDYTRALFSNYHYSPVNYEAAKAKRSKMNAYWRYPAIDMSYKAAVGYCEWLTAQYNAQPERKYKKVRFRLPTQPEWTMAALGYKEFTSWVLDENSVMAFTDWKKNKKEKKSFSLKEHAILYPWWHPNFNFKDKIRNEFGCYLANVKVPEEISCASGIKGDGWILTSSVGAYFANGMGLYDVVGNVAEMIDVEGKAMGGSWNHPPDESTISSANSYERSDPTVGFRLFMEVIEE